MNGLPYYKAYPRDFMEGTIGMPFELKGAYRLVLDLIYMQAGSLPDDPKYISAHLGCSIRAWNNYRAALINLGKVQAENGFICNFRASLEVDKLKIISDKQRENGAKGGKINGLRQAVAKPKHSQSDIDTEEVKREAKASPKIKGSRLQSDWFLPKDWGEWAVDQGWQFSQIKIEADKFRDYWTAKSGPGAVKLDWQATWRNWIRAANPRRYSNGKQPSANAAFGATINQLASDLSAGRITLDTSSRDPFAARPRGNA